MEGFGRPLKVLELGTVPYAESLELQADLVGQRRTGTIPDTLVLLEHPHVITLGSSSDPAHVLVDDAERTRLGIELFEAGRGGDVTYHGPGQLVAYPILDLKPDRKDLHRYLRDLETVLIGLAADYGIEAKRSDAGTGVWTTGGKLAAIGIRVSSGWITSHGIALNVRADLSYFETIVPCGIAEGGVTSIERELGAAPDPSEVADRFVRHFARVFERDIVVV
ncbi:MAG: lipoyl(octanoyl) transferase LipB [Gemmatimonadetes bacterium]|nr:lipoyl(octanoyl) transferase LipB [Gemmatimonadota bacterium]